MKQRAIVFLGDPTLLTLYRLCLPPPLEAYFLKSFRCIQSLRKSYIIEMEDEDAALIT